MFYRLFILFLRSFSLFCRNVLWELIRSYLLVESVFFDVPRDVYRL
jgi:hypothetical protein